MLVQMRNVSNPHAVQASFFATIHAKQWQQIKITVVHVVIFVAQARLALMANVNAVQPAQQTVAPIKILIV